MSPVLIVHVTGGILGIASGAVALLARKGSIVHRAGGWVFLVAMAAAGASASTLAAILPDWSNFPGGLFVVYLVLTGWATLARTPALARLATQAGLAIGGAAAACALLLGALAQRQPTLLAHGAPATLFVVGSFALFALALDLIAMRSAPSRGRLSRHLWRMCAALFVGTGSFFLGQQQTMPAWMQGSPVLVVLAVAPLVAMLVWMARLTLRRSPDAFPIGAAPRRG